MKKATPVEPIGFTLDEIDEVRKKDSDHIQISNTIMRNAREIYEVLEEKPAIYPCIRDVIQFEWETVDKDGFHNYFEANITDDHVRVYKCKYDPDNFMNCHENETSFYTIAVLSNQDMTWRFAKLLHKTPFVLSLMDGLIFSQIFF